MADHSSTAEHSRVTTPFRHTDTLEDATRVNSITTLPQKKEENGSTIETTTIATTIDESKLLDGRRLLLVHTGFLLSILLVALDQTIVATALPRLASEFQALDELTWIITAYFLTQAGLMLTLGQILTVAPTKWVYLITIAIFEIGSLICGVAPSMNVLIFGRAIQGVGASGIFISILTVIAQITRLEQRPLLFGTFGGVFALASVIGPLLGGVFTDKLTWRWCFYINLPFGAVSVAAVFFFLPAHPAPENPAHDGKTTFQKWLSLDWVGSVLSVGMITALLLPLQWGGVSKPWNDRVVIALFVVFGVLFIAFVAWEFKKGESAMMPLKLFRRRSQIGAGGAMFMFMVCFLAATYYLPLFYQAKGRSPVQSGIDILPFMMLAVFGTFLSGGIVNATGSYWYIVVTGPLVGAVGAGLLYTISENTSKAALVGYQIVFGIGLGVAFQLPVMAIQAEYADAPELIPQASSLLTFFQLLGGVVGIAIAGTVFNNQLTTELAKSASGLSPDLMMAVKQSVTVIFSLPEEIRAGVIHAYVKALDYTFILAVPAAVFGSIFAAMIKNWNLKTRGAAAGGAVAV